MRACPSCGQPGIHEHSVLVPLASLTGDQVRSLADVPVYARCVRCADLFRHDDRDTLVPAPPEMLDGQTVWIIPPWKPQTDEASFEMSWDVVEAFFERQAAEIDWVRPICEIITRLRDTGLDHRLRAGQSLNALGLSRSRDHGLRPDQSHLFLYPDPNGTVRVRGSIRGKPVDYRPATPELDDRLRQLIDDLLSTPVD